MGYYLDLNLITNLSRKSNIRSLSELCKRAGINKNSITPYIKGERSPFTQVIIEIANALGVSPTELISNNENPVSRTVKDKLIPLLDKQMAVFLFGSRSRGTNKKFSDIDLGLVGGKDKINFEKFSSFKSIVDDAFEDYHLSVNLVNLDMAPNNFLLQVEPDLMYLCGDTNSASYFQGYLSARKKN